MTSMFLAKFIPLVSLFISGAWAQFDMAKCGAGYEWSYNSLGQDPCAIGSALDASCRSLVLYTYPPLNASQYYIPPRVNNSGDLTCDCNTVMYNLYMACAVCQEGQIYPWTRWIPACQSVYVSQIPFDIPQGTAVPRWAYFNVTTSTNQTYDQATMITVGRNPEEMPKVSSTVSAGSSTTSPGKTGTGGLVDPTATGGSSSNTKGGTNVGAIVGGVVGSVVPLTILAVVLFFYSRHRRQQQSAPQQIQNQDQYQQHPPSMYGPPLGSPSFTPYNPSDPSTFPPQSPPSSVTYTTTGNNQYVRGAYSGVPEV